MKILAGQEEPKQRVEEFLLAVSICHHGNRVLRFGEQGLKSSFKSLYPDEEAQLDLAFQLGFEFKYRQNDIINLKKSSLTQGYNLRLQEILSRRLQVKGEWITVIIVKGNFGEDARIYFKGPHSLIELMLADIDRTDKSVRRRVFHEISFAKRSIDEHSLEKLTRLIHETKVSHQRTELELDEFLMSLAT